MRIKRHLFSYISYIRKRIDQIYQTIFVFPQSYEQKKRRSSLQIYVIKKCVHLFIHLNLNPICIFCTSKHFYNFKYFMVWIIIFASVVKKFSHFPNNFPSLFLRFMCNKPQHQPSAIFYYLCVVQCKDKREQCESVV